MEEDADKKCADKLAFDTKKQAINTATVAKYQHNGQKLKPYKCHDCGLWHLATDWR